MEEGEERFTRHSYRRQTKKVYCLLEGCSRDEELRFLADVLGAGIEKSGTVKRFQRLPRDLLTDVVHRYADMQAVSSDAERFVDFKGVEHVFEGKFGIKRRVEAGF